MRALCVQQPWASLIRDGIKSLEVRSWTTKHRGDVLILASLKWSAHDAASLWQRYVEEQRGCMVCIVELVDVREGRARDAEACGGVDPRGHYVWQLANPRPVVPRPVKGRLGLFDASDLHVRYAP